MGEERGRFGKGLHILHNVINAPLLLVFNRDNR